MIEDDQNRDSLLNQIASLELKLKTKDELINNLQNSMELKDVQIKTIKDSINLKDEQIETLDNTLKIKDEKISTLEKSVALKDEKFLSLKENMIEKEPFEKQLKENKDLQRKLDILKQELIKADEDLEVLEAENEKLRNQLESSSGTKLIDWTNIEIPKSLILEKMRDILMNAVHNVLLTVPSIQDLQELYLYEIRSSVSIKASCSIDISLEDDAMLLEELESLDNITIRLFESEDRYVIERDGEELLFAVIGNAKNNHLVLHTRDAKHIKFFKSLIMEAWLRARKIE
jgi:hypothetical protein